MKFKLVIIGLLALILGGGIWLFLDDKADSLINPLGIKQKSEQRKVDYKVFGFLPTWMIGKTKIYEDEVNNLVFLGIEVNENGNFIWDSQSKKINNETYLDQKAKIKKAGGKNILGIKLFDDNKIAKLMASDSARANLIEQIKKIMKEEGFEGVNVDFEYQGNPTAVLEDEFYGFIHELNVAGVENISLDVFANTLIKGEGLNLNRIIGEVDDLIVMAYDFHRSGSTIAGAVAPIGSPIGERNILEVVQKVTEANLERKKITLAFPLYGYEWKTDSTDFGSETKKGWIALASYKRMKEMLSNKNKIVDLKENWDEVSMSPWISYTDNGVTKQIYYENLESIKRKLNLVSDNKLGGVGFWALGYEGEHVEVWDEVEKIK